MALLLDLGQGHTSPQPLVYSEETTLQYVSTALQRFWGGLGFRLPESDAKVAQGASFRIDFKHLEG